MSRSEKGLDDVLVAKAVEISEIPVIDFSPFLQGNAADRQAVAAALAEACERIGFFYLVGHGVPESLRSAIFEQSAAFFHLPLERRRQAAATPDWYRGWIASQPGETLSRDSRVFEQYRIQADLPADDPDVASGSVFYKPNRWPADLPDFGTVCNRYYRAMLELSRQLLHAFALGIGLPEDRFDAYFDKPLCQLSMMYYPSLPGDADPEVTNTVSHTDEGPLTILAQGEVSGLEVKRRDGTWIAAPPIPGAYTINVGDMMMWWSNGRYLSNYHRVRNKSRTERFSVPFFLNPDHDATIAPLPEFVREDGGAHYPPVHVATHLSRFYATFKYEPSGTDAPA
ncbi:isopenicillin N synthase family dioxygenase [Telmatospirillum siberiense]|uniref:2-oxoglutarate-dependent ethylene/succinate-forming enzyme n=1 Tax=Telmatospirillum siberiense TaxID=382514 RepID=A0A2N3PPU0_9PROT|nr:2-oxoglutarate and iron-dependent oxygenase domain-containing protein [Telmatospirillum siberiense]PKU22416.1 isopenicillin N synthase family oxygenase [Telmatospirillum siberiense]